MVESKEIININNYNIPMSWMQLKLSERYIKYDTILDIIIIEIKIDADKIKEELFLIPNLEEINLINKEIYIIQYPAGQNLSYSTGNIIDVVNDELVYNASTKEGSSGSAILLKNTTKVIGVHKQGNKLGKKENYGVLISSCIKLLQSKNDEVEIKLINKQKIIYENGDYYIGQALNGKAHGKGILYYKNGLIIYDGDFVNGKFEGTGKRNWEGKYYIGQWLNGKRHGKGIMFDKNDNILYDGYYIDNKKEGEGRIIYENKNFYIGQWLDNKRHGKGKEYYKNNELRYDGDFANDRYEGYGIFIAEDGSYYVGQWLNGKKHGKGEEYTKKGKCIYDGDFINDMYEGNGKYVYENKEYYIGKWSNGNRQGKGILYYKNGNVKYDGDFVNDKKEGNGKFINEDGEYYIGQ
jgi:hypothetical protein